MHFLTDSLLACWFTKSRVKRAGRTRQRRLGRNSRSQWNQGDFSLSQHHRMIPSVQTQVLCDDFSPWKTYCCYSIVNPTTHSKYWWNKALRWLLSAVRRLNQPLFQLDETAQAFPIWDIVSSLALNVVILTRSASNMCLRYLHKVYLSTYSCYYKCRADLLESPLNRVSLALPELLVSEGLWVFR